MGPMRFTLSRIVLLLMLCHVVIGCGTLSRFKPRSPTDKATAATPQEASAREADNKEEKGDDDDSDGDAARLIAVDQTPFFRWLRSGLRKDAKPSRFLSASTKVLLLKENEEDKFSRVRLPDGKKGWVPSRFLTELSKEKQTEAAGTPGKPDPAEAVAGPPSLEPLRAADPASLPGSEAALPSIPADKRPKPIINDFGIRTSRPKPAPPSIPAESGESPAPQEGN